MNTTDLVTKVYAANPKITKAEARNIVNVVLSGIEEGLAKGENVTLKGFGTFRVTLANARKGRNPLTGDILDIPESKRIKFKASKGLKEAVA